MPLNQITINAWLLQYTVSDGYVGLDVTVPAMQAQVQFHADCPNGNLVIDKIILLNSDSLETLTSGVMQRYPVNPGNNLVDGQSYITRAEVVISAIVTAAEWKYGVYWADCAPPVAQSGIPRFAFQARTAVQFQAITNYYTQTWAKKTGWDPLNPKPAYSSTPVNVRLTSGWSGLDQIGAPTLIAQDACRCLRARVETGCGIRPRSCKFSHHRRGRGREQVPRRPNLAPDCSKKRRQSRSIRILREYFTTLFGV